MKLQKGTIRPGLVLEVLENGCIKASAPGLFSFEDDPEKMPKITPWQIGCNCGSFSQPKQYDEVWIMNFSDNPRQLYWFRKDDTMVHENIPIAEENVEIICNRDVGGDWATIYFSDGSGWVISKGESKINIKTDGSILLTNGMPNRSIHITGESISIGSENKSASPAAKGDKTEEAIMAICSLLSSVAIKALTNPYTAIIGSEIMAKLPNATGKIPEISSNNVTID